MTPSPDREQLKWLLDLIPEEDLPTVERLLLGLIALDRDTAVAVLANPAFRSRNDPRGGAQPPSRPAPAAQTGDPLAEGGADIEQARRHLLDLLEDD